MYLYKSSRVSGTSESCAHESVSRACAVREKNVGVGSGPARPSGSRTGGAEGGWDVGGETQEDSPETEEAAEGGAGGLAGGRAGEAERLTREEA